MESGKGDTLPDINDEGLADEIRGWLYITGKYLMNRKCEYKIFDELYIVYVYMACLEAEIIILLQIR